MIVPWRPSLSIGLIIGTAAGLLDGVATLQRNVYAPHFAILCLGGPIPLTTALAAILAGLFGTLAQFLRWQSEVVTARVGALIVVSLVTVWSMLWWGGLGGNARAS